MQSVRSRNGIWIMTAISAAYWFCAGMRAMYRPFWQDELYTWHIAQLAGLRTMWDVLRAGTDQNLPLAHIAARVSQSLFGPGELATRLPFTFGFWIMLLAVYVFLKRRLPLPYALVGTLFPMLTFAWPYAYEARGYGIVLGCAGIALVAWQTGAEGRRRTLSLVALAVALGIALGTHYSALMLAVPLGGGEIVRSLQRRKVDIGVWVAFAAACPVVLMYPLLIAATRNWDLHGLNPTFSIIGGFYGTALRTAVGPLVAAGAAAYVLGRGGEKGAFADPGMPVHETAALVGFVLAPAFFFMPGLHSQHFIFAQRYGVPMAIGAGGCLALLLFRAAAGSLRVAWVFVVVISGWLGLARVKESLGERRPPAVQVREENPLLNQALADGRPVVVTDQQLFLQADHYLPREAGHMYNLVDWEAGRHYMEQDQANQLTTRAARYLPLRAHVELWQDFARSHPQFLLHSDERYQQWFYDLLLREGWNLKMKARRGAESLIEVSAPADTPAH
jgi:hypothetical protein